MIHLRLELPPLSDETAARLLDFLQQLATAFENEYVSQLRRYYEPQGPDTLDLFDDCEDELPPF